MKLQYDTLWVVDENFLYEFTRKVVKKSKLLIHFMQYARQRKEQMPSTYKPTNAFPAGESN